MNSFYWKPPFKPAREEDCSRRCCRNTSAHMNTPATWCLRPTGQVQRQASGVQPTRSRRKYVGDVSAFYAINPKPACCGCAATTTRSSATIAVRLGTLGMLGAIPGWPGDGDLPAAADGRPDARCAGAVQDGGRAIHRNRLRGCGHTPYIEKPDGIQPAFHAHLGDHVANGACRTLKTIVSFQKYGLSDWRLTAIRIQQVVWRKLYLTAASINLIAPSWKNFR